MSGESDIAQKVHNTNNTNDRRERCKWTPAEDMALISAWLNTSKHPVVGNEEQKAAAFWKRIAMHYQKRGPGVNSNLRRREWNTCKQRWQRLNAKVCKFVGCYDHALSQTSGQSEDDVIQAAYQFYCTNYKTTFTLEHAWRELRHNEKWCTSQSSNGGGSSKRTKLTEGGTYSLSSNTKNHPINLDVEEQAMAPPPSVKSSSKCQGKKVAAKTTNEEREASSLLRLENLLALKEKDIQLSRMEMLKTLLTKTKQLSEKEERLKNKLIDEML